MINHKKCANRLVWVIGFSNYCQETWKENQPTSNHKNNRKLKNNRKIKAMWNITPIMDHYPRKRKIGDTDP